MGELDFRVQKGIIVGDGNIQVNSAATATVLAKKFDTDVSTSGSTLTGITWAADGTDSNINLNLTPKGSGSVIATRIDNTPIGGGTPNSGAFTTLSATGAVTLGQAASGGTVTQAASSANANAADLTITAGSPPTGGNNDAGTGGDLILAAGAGKGQADGGDIVFKVATPAGSAANTPNAINDVALTLSDDKSAAFGGAVDINSGTIDGTNIGANATGTVKSSTMETTSWAKFGGAARQATTQMQVNAPPKGGGSGGSTLLTVEGRLHTDISNDDVEGSWNDYTGMADVFILDNVENCAKGGQAVVFTEGRTGTSGSGSAWAIGRLRQSTAAAGGLFSIGYVAKSYEDIGYANASNNGPHAGNPAGTAQSVVQINTAGDLQLMKGEANASEGRLVFTGAESDDTTQTVSFKAPHATMTASSAYTWPIAPAGQNGYVLSTTTAGVMSWIAAAGGLDVSGTDNRMVRMHNTDDIQDTGITVSDADAISGVSTLATTDAITVSKDTDGEFIALTLTNESDAANTTGYVSQLFNLEDSGGNAVDSGKITVLKEASFTATGSTQDSAMVFMTSLNGALAERVRIKSSGVVETTSGLILSGTITGASDITLSGDLTVGDDIILSSDNGIISPSANAGTNQAGKHIFIKGGAGTGNGTSGSVIFQTKTADGASSTDTHTLGNTMTLSGGNVTIHGDLTVSGDSISANVATLDVEDKNITLNKGGGDTSSTADGAGITIQDAVDASNDATLLWDQTNSEFDFSHEVTAPALTVDNIFIDGSTIGHTSDTDIMTLASAALTLANNVDFNVAKAGGLQIAGAAVTATATELNWNDTNAALGTVVASKTLTVDASRDVATIRNLTSDGAVRGATLSVDAVAVLDTSRESSNQSWANDSVNTIATFVANTYRTVKFVGEISNGTDSDSFEVLVTWKGTGGNPSGNNGTNEHSNIFLTTYAYVATSGTPLGTLHAVRDSNSGDNIDLDFKVGAAAGGNYRYVVTATHLVNNYAT